MIVPFFFQFFGDDQVGLHAVSYGMGYFQLSFLPDMAASPNGFSLCNPALSRSSLHNAKLRDGFVREPGEVGGEAILQKLLFLPRKTGFFAFSLSSSRTHRYRLFSDLSRNIPPKRALKTVSLTEEPPWYRPPCFPLPEGCSPTEF